MKWDLQGTVMQILNTELKPGEKIISESGKMMYMTDNIKMETKALGGLWKSLKRKFAHESFFLVEFSPQGGNGVVAFASEVPGKIIPAKLKAGEELICQKDAFLCSDTSVQFDAAFTKRLGAGFLGGEGLILIKVKGPGQAFLNVGGEVTKVDLEAGQKVRIDTTCLAMFDATMDYSVERVKGIKNILWGGEGLFLATITGPGRVWIQSMPIAELAAKLAQYMPSEKRAKAKAAGGLLRTLGRFGR
jgi:uncharacterized protein (TIGR00266 family)